MYLIINKTEINDTKEIVKKYINRFTHTNLQNQQQRLTLCRLYQRICR